MLVARTGSWVCRRGGLPNISPTFLLGDPALWFLVGNMPVCVCVCVCVCAEKNIEANLRSDVGQRSEIRNLVKPEDWISPAVSRYLVLMGLLVILFLLCVRIMR
jgi:hypothetical protein